MENIIDHGCYLVFNRLIGKFARAGLASAKLGHKDAKGIQCSRMNGRTKAFTKCQRKKVFCNYYPAMECSSKRLTS